RVTIARVSTKTLIESPRAMPRESASARGCQSRLSSHLVTLSMSHFPKWLCPQSSPCRSRPALCLLFVAASNSARCHLLSYSEGTVCHYTFAKPTGGAKVKG